MVTLTGNGREEGKMDREDFWVQDSGIITDLRTMEDGRLVVVAKELKKEAY